MNIAGVQPGIGRGEGRLLREPMHLTTLKRFKSSSAARSSGQCADNKYILHTNDKGEPGGGRWYSSSYRRNKTKALEGWQFKIQTERRLKRYVQVYTYLQWKSVEPGRARFANRQGERKCAIREQRFRKLSAGFLYTWRVCCTH